MKSMGFVAVFFAATCIGPSVSHAGWIDKGMPLSSRWGSIGNERVITDGASGAIIVFQACLHGCGRIYAQRVDASGAPQWAANAVGVCAADGNQWEPQAAADGAGGVIIAWSDSRGGSEAIYAQRLDAAGVPLWAASGVVVCAVADQQNVRIISDGAGGAIIVWQDSRSGSFYLYAQRVNASGDVQWPLNGVTVCAAAGQENPSAASDGSGGAIIAWSDSRAGNNDIYAQRVSSSGLPQWTVNGVGICTITGYEHHPLAVADGAGGAIIAWSDSLATIYQDIRVQRVNSAGVIQWESSGVNLCATAIPRKNPRAAADGLGGIIIAWEATAGDGWPDFYAQRLDGSATRLWGDEGLAICTADHRQQSMTLIPDGFGGATFTWADFRSLSSDDIYAQRVDASGAVQWAVNGVAVCGWTSSQSAPQIVPSVAGGAIILWRDGRSTDPVYGQRLSDSGAVQWTASGVAILRAPDNQMYPAAVSDGAGGAFIAWVDEYDGNDIYAQHMDAWGHTLWQTGGIAVCTAGNDQGSIAMIPDGAGGMFIAWSDGRSVSSPAIYAQRFDASGAPQWTVNGVLAVSPYGQQITPRLVSDGSDGVIVIGSNLRVQRLNGAGVAQWAAGGVSIGTPAPPEAVAAIPDGAGGAIIAWHAWLGGSRHDIYAQRINALGAVQWEAGGLAVCSEPQSQIYPVLAPDGAGGAIIAWIDGRAGGIYSDIYAQRLNGDGIAQWTANGLPISTVAETGLQIRMASDGAGGGIISYLRQSGTNGISDLYAQRFDVSGNVLWGANDVAVCTAGGQQDMPQIIPDYAGGAVIAWVDGRGDHDIYAQRVDAAGSALWTPNGLAVCFAYYDQSFLSACGDGAGGAILAWADRRCTNYAIYVQRVTVSGGFVATLLQTHSATIEGAGVRVDWVLSDVDADTRFFVMRAEQPDWAYEELTDLPIAREGLAFRVMDKTCLPGTAYKYRIDYAAPSQERRSLFETESVVLPALPAILYQNHPNPFNPWTVIRFYLPQTEDIALDIFDLTGGIVARLAHARMEHGYHEIIWDGKNGSGAACASGIYFSRLRTGTGALSRKIVLLR